MRRTVFKLLMYIYGDRGPFFGSPIPEALPSYARRFPSFYNVIIVLAQGPLMPRRLLLLRSQSL
jgi:hypothetical protein